jgi:DNA primase small subunit
VIKGGKEMQKKVNVRTGSRSLHPMLSEAVESLSDKFAEIVLDDQECFRDKKGWEALLALLPEPGVFSSTLFSMSWYTESFVSLAELVNALREKWEDDEDRTSSDKWDDLKKEIVRRFGKDTKERVSLD